MKRKNKILLTAGLLILSLSICITGVAVSYANYKAVEKVNQLVGYQGKETQYTVFLNAGSSGNYWNTGGALFYMYYTYDGNEGHWGWLAKAEELVSVSVGNTTYRLQVFVLPAPTQNCRLLFARINPNGTNIPRFNNQDETGDNRPCWNKTENINLVYNTNYHNYYEIIGWNENSYHRGNIVLDRTNNSLSFSINPY